MKTRQFSFGFTEIEDEKTGSTVLIQHRRNEIRTRLSIEKGAEWLSFDVPLKNPRNPLPVENFIAYPHPLELENKRIKDLRSHKAYLPAKYHQIEIYNLPDNDISKEEELDESESD